MTNNIQKGAPPGRRERDRDSGRGSEAVGAGGRLNAVSVDLGCDPVVRRELFRARPLEESVREWLSHLQRAADLFSDEEILALGEDGAGQLVERLVVEPLVLLESEAYIEDHGSTRASVLVVPFTGDPDFFELDPRPPRSRSGRGCMPGPFGRVTEDTLYVELTNTPGLSPGDQVVETRLAPVRHHVRSLRSALERDHAANSTCVVSHAWQCARRGRSERTSSSVRTSRSRANPHRASAPPQSGQRSRCAARSASRTSGSTVIANTLNTFSLTIAVASPRRGRGRLVLKRLPDPARPRATTARRPSPALAQRSWTGPRNHAICGQQKPAVCGPSARSRVDHHHADDPDHPAARPMITLRVVSTPIRHHRTCRLTLERFQADLRDVGLRALEQRREHAEVRRGPLAADPTT